MDRQLSTEKESVGHAIFFEFVQRFGERACRNPTQLVRVLCDT
jgi:hypothetical protein